MVIVISNAMKKMYIGKRRLGWKKKGIRWYQCSAVVYAGPMMCAMYRVRRWGGSCHFCPSPKPMENAVARLLG